ncbi:MAG: hypothetical protein LC723_04140 [Actinobacteria bacterium]|nr:hypothetical protein [Actinomycetota bacterium]
MELPEREVQIGEWILDLTPEERDLMAEALEIWLSEWESEMPAAVANDPMMESVEDLATTSREHGLRIDLAHELIRKLRGA